MNTPRVSPDSIRTVEEFERAIQSPFIRLQGNVVFDMANAADLALITAGTPKAVSWYAGGGTYDLAHPPDADLRAYPGALSAFGIRLTGYWYDRGAAAYLWDQSAEVTLKTAGVGAHIHAASWIWGTEFASIAPNIGTYDSTIMGYQGMPIVPNLYVRSGFIAGQTNAAARISYQFELRALLQSDYGSGGVYIPEPFCVPPFCPVTASPSGANGKWLFCDHATKPFPVPQPGPWRRVWRSKTIQQAIAAGSSFDARIFGGPWNVRYVAAADQNIVGSVNQILSGLSPTDGAAPYTPLALDTSTAKVVSLEGKKVCDAAQISAVKSVSDAVSNNEILLYYP